MLEQLIKTVETKNNLDQNRECFQWSKTYFDALIEEAEEVRKELKEGNRVHLEDELGDVLRVYLNLLEILEHEWKISSLESVLNRAEKKFEERITFISGAEGEEWKAQAWQDIKKIQKQRLAEEHKKLYW